MDGKSSLRLKLHRTVPINLQKLQGIHSREPEPAGFFEWSDLGHQAQVEQPRPISLQKWSHPSRIGGIWEKQKAQGRCWKESYRVHEWHAALFGRSIEWNWAYSIVLERSKWSCWSLEQYLWRPSKFVNIIHISLPRILCSWRGSKAILGLQNSHQLNRKIVFGRTIHDLPSTESIWDYLLFIQWIAQASHRWLQIALVAK